MLEMRMKALAKINLGLDVLRRREDGYHEVRMIMQTLRMYDKIALKRTKEPGIRLKSNLFYVPEDEGNLAYRAAKLLKRAFLLIYRNLFRLRQEWQEEVPTQLQCCMVSIGCSASICLRNS